MAKVSLAEHMQEKRATEPDPENTGPFITISREYGCWGFSLGLLLLDTLNEDPAVKEPWHIYHKEILDRLAEQSNLDKEVIERQRRQKPRLLTDLFRSLKGDRLPTGHEIRMRMTGIIRSLAIKGRASLVGQDSSGATTDLPNGLSVRLEAPVDWRVKQIAFREGLTETEARLRMQAKQREREYLHKVYESRFRRQPAFHLVYDCSVFTLAQIAQHVFAAMKMKGYLR